jgi:hypothetical protein
MSVSAARTESIVIAALALVLFCCFVSSAGQYRARASDKSLAAGAQPLGEPLSTIIEFGEQYVTGDIPYEARITVVKVLRGAPADALVKSASASNPSAKKGFEYVAARIRFAFSARVAPAHDAYTLDASQFSSISNEGATYPAPKLVAQPKPGLHATLRSGDSADGWVVLLVPLGDRTPLLLFVPNLGTTSHTGDSYVFRLYAATPLGSSAKSSYAIPIQQGGSRRSSAAF